jgi:heterodisulfide reductase subunit A-like polyferredoxin
MCTISPRLIDIARHDNIELITGAELDELEGSTGDFSARLQLEPRYVDIEKCNACGECLEVCPVRVPASFEAGTAARTAIHRRYPQAVPGEFAIDKHGTSPCRISCPAGCNAHAYIALIGQGRYDRAIGIIRETLPLPGVLGRICDHPCESGCHRHGVDQALAIRNLKRFAADWEADHAEIGDHGLPLLDADGRGQVAHVERKPQRVAIVGSGPAGLTAARDLVLEGYGVAVFEAQPEAGGMLRYGIPRYRLEADVLDRDIQSILDLGVELCTGTRVGDPELLLERAGDRADDGYDAVFVAVGAWRGRRLGVPGEDVRGVWQGLDFLARVNSGEPVPVGGRVVVIGGGDVAVDAARSARRLAGVHEVRVVSLESRDQLQAHPWEVTEAEEEGIEFVTGWGPTEFREADREVNAVVLRACTRVFDPDGAFAPLFDDSRKQIMEADSVIVTIGQALAPEGLGGVARESGWVATDPTTLATSVAGVFAGGDAVLGPATAVQAIAQGHRAAESIVRFLRGDDLERGRTPSHLEEAPAPTTTHERRRRRPMPTIDLESRVTTFDALETGYGESEAVAEAGRCLNCGGCCECLECVRVCSPRGIDHAMTAGERRLEVGAVILAGGCGTFDPAAAGLYLYGQAPNVVTNLAFERLCSSSGPTGGELRRPGDGAMPRRIAWIQCVGSRDVSCGRDYCSGYCCMASIKEAVMIRDHDPDCETTIFYNDIRAYGKGFEHYFTNARDAAGVAFVKSLPSRISESTRTGDLTVHFSHEDGSLEDREFDMVVLATGLEVGVEARRLTEVSGVETDRFGFCRTDGVLPGATSRPGVFVAGSLEQPRDIPDNVVSGSAAAAGAMALLSAVRGSEVTTRELPPERDIAEEAPRVGVFVCRCGTNIARVVDVPTLADYAATLPNVVHAEENSYTCSTDTRKRIIDQISDNDINRVVVCSCTPRTHEPLFRETIREAGLNPYLFEMANIRDQCSWVHEPWPERATDKARGLLRMAIARAARLEPIEERSSEVVPNALVVGGGVAGMTAALNISRQGFGVTLVERDGQLGGQVRQLRSVAGGVDSGAILERLASSVRDDPGIEVMLGSRPVGCDGHIGRYRTAVQSAGGGSRVVEHGIVVLAAGAVEYRGNDFGLGRHPAVCTQRELEAEIAEAETDIGRCVVMIQCVGSRSDDHSYCSKVCCQGAVKNALALKARDPRCAVYVLHRGIRTYGLSELDYRRAREAGVIFVRFDDDDPPGVELDSNRPVVEIRDPAVDHVFRLPASRLVLSTGIVADAGIGELASVFKLPVDEDGFLLEAHVKLRPVDLPNDGMFLCGTAHAPKTVVESMVQAMAAASRAAAVLSKERLAMSGVTARIDPELCAACLTCVRVCPYGVPRMDDDAASMTVDQASCHGCATCAAACPMQAIEVGHSKPEQIVAILGAVTEDGMEVPG